MGTEPPENRYPIPIISGLDISTLPIAEISAHLSSGRLTSVALTRCYLKRISQVNPRIRAIIEVNPSAISIAEALDAERAKNKKPRSPLHGIPFVVKDNISTVDPMHTTAGCAALLHTRPGADASAIALLRAAGAIVLAKANLSEWASMRASYYAEGYSARGGLNRNPFDLAQHPGGSSSGSASAVATDMCAFSVGTETDGSVAFPADRCGVVGIKATVGLVGTDGVVPEAESFDALGVFGRWVADAAVALGAMVDRSKVPKEVLDRDTSKGKDALYTSWLAKKDALKGARFGVPQKRIWEVAKKNDNRFLDESELQVVIRKMREAGAEVINVDIPSYKEIIPPDGIWDWEYAEGKSGSKLSEFQVVRIEFYRNLKKYLANLEGNENGILSLEDVVKYNIKHIDTEGAVPGTHPAWPSGQDCFEKCLKTTAEDEAIRAKALQYLRRQSRELGIDAALQTSKGRLDGLLVPLQAEGGVASSVAAKAGYPIIAIPYEVDENGVPFGMGIIQTAFQEHLLIKYASAIEDLLDSSLRVLPRYRNHDATNYPYVGRPPKKSI